MKRGLLKLLVTAIVITALAACTTPTPETIVETVIEEVEVPGDTIVETVEVPVEVPADVETIMVNMGYIPDVQFAPFYVGIEQGFFLEEGLQVVPDFSTEVDGYSLVASGTIPFAIGGGADILAARSQGMPLVMVMRWYNGQPAAIVSLAENGIETPADLVGKTVGTPGFYGILYKAPMAMLASEGLTTDDINLEAIGWTQIAAVTEGLVDAAVVYANNEPVQMMWNGQDINVLDLNPFHNFADIGVHTSEDVIENNPELVKRFIRAFMRSIKFCVDNPEEALDAAMRAVGVFGWERSKAEMALAESLALWAPVDGLYGLWDAEDFEWSQEFLLGSGEMETGIDVTTAFTNDFVEEVGQP